MKLTLIAFSALFYSAQSFAALHDISLPNSRKACTSKSPLVGTGSELSSLAHGVSGTVYVIDDCTLAIDNFHYDGKGLKVEIYSSKNGDFTEGRPLSIDLLRPTQAYDNDLMILRLPKGQSVETIEGLSVWCSDAKVSFGDVLFEK